MLGQKTKRPSLKDLLAGGDLISPEELAAALKVARVTIYAWTRRQVVPFIRIEGVLRFAPEQIAEWLKTKHQAARKAPGGGAAT